MDFAFSEEQELLRRSAREFLADRYTLERVAAIADGDGFDRAEWREVADLGWTGISVPASEGGAGLGFLEEAVVAEELGRALYPGPFMACVILALPLLAAGGARDAVRRIVAGELVATVAWAGPDGRFDVGPAPAVSWDGGRLTADKLFVPALAASDLLLVVGTTADGPGLWSIDRDAAGVAWREFATVDSTRRMGEVRLEEARAEHLLVEQARWPERLRDRALAALAAEAVGVGSHALELALDHARTRRQFGRPIGAFQAVAHQLVQAYLEVETARSLVYWAAWAVAEDAPEAPAAAAAAKARAAEAAVAACERAIQTHGGMGFTWEHPLQRLYKRALAIAHYLGTGAELRSRLATLLLES